MKGSELAAALLALDDPDLPVLVETDWDAASCGCCNEIAHGNVPIVGLRVEDGAIFFDEGDPVLCAAWHCRHEARHEGSDGKLYCDDCTGQAQREAEKAAVEQREADYKAYKAAWRQALTGIG